MKIGDKVVLLDNVYNNEDDDDMAPGRTGVIYGESVGGRYFHVTLDGEPVEGEQNWTFLPSELEVINETA